MDPKISALQETASGTSTPGTGTGTSTPHFNTTSYEHNASVTLADLCAKGGSLYDRKQYAEAADAFARAAELQAEVRGEMSVENAEVLFCYGRALFRVGQGRSDVLGGVEGGKAKKGEMKGKEMKGKKEVRTEEEKITEAGVAIAAEAKEPGIVEDAKSELPEAKKPLFQFMGDENFDTDSDDDDDDDDDAEQEEAEEEDEDELATAFEVLEVARVLFERRLESALASNPPTKPSSPKGKGKAAATHDAPEEKLETNPTLTHLKTRLSDTHDLLAEISLENERFPAAVADFRAALGYKNNLYPFSDGMIAEAYYKLSLALEFASITTTNEEDSGGGDGNADNGMGGLEEKQVDEAMREEAATALESAIKSTESKLALKTSSLSSLPEGDDAAALLREDVKDIKEMIADMRQRLTDLRAPPVDLNTALSGGVLGGAVGESAAESAKRLEEAKANANDLSGMVRRKKPAAAVESGKRKAEEVSEAESEAKKVKTDKDA